MSWLSEEIERLQENGTAHVWVAPDGDELVYQATEGGPLIAVNEYGSDPLRGEEPPDDYEPITGQTGGR